MSICNGIKKSQSFSVLDLRKRQLVSVIAYYGHWLTRVQTNWGFSNRNQILNFDIWKVLCQFVCPQPFMSKIPNDFFFLKVYSIWRYVSPWSIQSKSSGTKPEWNNPIFWVKTSRSGLSTFFEPQRQGLIIFSYLSHFLFWFLEMPICIRPLCAWVKPC